MSAATEVAEGRKRIALEYAKQIHYATGVIAGPGISKEAEQACLGRVVELVLKAIEESHRA